MNIALLLLGTVLAFFVTGAVRRYALSAQIVDIPNSRSSHAVPTPRGGGVAIVVSFLAVLLALATVHPVPTRLLAALFGSGLVIAVTGFIDDYGHLAARWRFLSHFAASVWALWMMKGIPPVPLFGLSVDLGWFGLALAALYLVWMVNLYNFMDGIDGIASVQAITVAAGGALTWWLATGTPHWTLPLAFAACVAGFLAWNYPPAKVFMGDVGSGFLGMILGLFSLWAGHEAPQVFWCWFILGGCFMVDATTTLVRRVRRGERFYEAHRSHAYQYASRRHGSHRNVSLAVGAINLLWLLPLATLVAIGILDGLVGVIIGYLPLVWLAFRYKAGDRAAQEA
jgi:Fuc2NAc and GlcNAc transferase